METKLIWNKLTDNLSTTTFNEWKISAHLERVKYEPDKTLYVGTKDGEKRIVTHDWDKVKQALYKSTVAPLF